MAAAVPYLVVGAVGLLGEWLLGPKSSATNNTQPNAMPSVNQALRGTPLFICFGSVRVSAQIIWTKNWKAIRQKGGGKGAAKGGGSGGGGAAKGGASGAYGYKYSWDLIFHFGMVDVPCLVTKAWIGSDRVKSSTVVGWNADFPNASNIVSTGEGTADMTATEAFYSPGYATGDPALTAWPYFNTQEGVSPAWPSTCWLGFNQLDLGTTPAVPQLSVELTPNSTDFHVNHTVYDNPDNPISGLSPVPLMKADGNLYQVLEVFPGTSNNGATIQEVQTGTTLTLSDTQGQADVTAIHGSAGNRMGVFGVPYSPYFYNAFLYDDLTSPSVVFVLYKIESGAINQVGSVTYTYVNGFRKNFTGAISAGRMPNGDVALAYFGRSIDHGSYLTTIKSPESVEGGDSTVAGDISTLSYELPFGDNFFGNVTSSSGRPVAQVTFLPPSDPTATTVKVLIYICRERVQDEITAGNNTFIQTEGATYPDGFMLSYDYAGGSGSGLTTDWKINEFLNDQHGSAVVPFSDVYKTSTGGAGNAYDDYFMAHTESGYLIVGRAYSDVLYKAHVMIFDLTGALVADFIEDYSDTTEWGGNGPPGPTSNATVQMNFYLDPDDSTLWFTSTRAQSATGETIKYVQFGGLIFASVDLTPPEIIKKILTSDVYGFATSTLFGFTITPDTIDNDSYQDAVNKCKSEGLKIAVAYTNQDALLTIINDLLALYGGTLAEQNHKIFFDVFRAGDQPIRTIDNDHLIRTADGGAPVSVTKGALQDGYNSVQYQYQDRAIDYKRNQVTVSDEVDIDLNGYRNKIYPSNFVMTGSVANIVAERALWSNMYGRDNYEFKLGWKDSDLRPGNQITLVDSWHPALSKGVKVVINKKQESERGVFTMNATRIYDNHLTAQHGYTNVASVDPGVDAILETPDAMLATRAYELPQEFQGSNGYVYFGYNQSTYVAGAQLYISRDLGANYVLTQDVQPFIISGRMAQSLPLREPGAVERGAEIYLFPRSGFNVSTPDFIGSYTLDDATPALRQSGLTTIIVGSEALAMEGLTLLGENHYRIEKLYRGWGGTPIAAVSSGAFWHEHAAGIFAFPITEDDIGNRLFYKIIGYNFAGRAFDISSVAAQQYDVKGLRWLPRAATRPRLFVASPTAWDPAKEVRAPYLAVASGGSPVTLSWPDAANNEGFGSGGAGAGGFGHFASDGTITGWRIDVASKNGVKVSSFVVSTRSFGYSVAQNSADFGGFAQDVIYSVTPFNVKGDGPTTYSRSLSQIW